MSNIDNIQKNLQSCEILIDGLKNFTQITANEDEFMATKEMRMVNILSLLRIVNEITLDELKDQQDAMARLEKMIAEGEVNE